MATRTISGVEVLTVTECPHREMTLDRVRQALDGVGASQVVVTERVIDDPETAAAAGMHGSPTVLIDGHDPFAAPGVEASVSCRLYPAVSGFDGAPTVDDLIVAVARAGRALR